jgi:hypothetical protein
MRESARTDLREPQGSNPLGPPGPELRRRDLRGFLTLFPLLGRVDKVELPTMSAQRRRAGADEVGRMKQSVTASSRVPPLRRGHGGRFPRTDTREEDSSGNFSLEVQVVTMKVR